MSPVSQKWNELRPFLWVKSRQNLQSIKSWNLKISLTLWDLDTIFVKLTYIPEGIQKILRSNNNLELLNWIRALCAQYHLSMQHLSWDKIWLFTIATSPEVSNILAAILPVWTKQSNFKLATEPNQNLTNSNLCLAKLSPSLFLLNFFKSFKHSKVLKV